MIFCPSLQCKNPSFSNKAYLLHYLTTFWWVLRPGPLVRGSASWSVVNLPQKHLVPTSSQKRLTAGKGTNWKAAKLSNKNPKNPLQSLPKRYSMRMYSSCFIHYLVFKMTKVWSWHLWFSHNVWLPLQGLSYHLCPEFQTGQRPELRGLTNAPLMQGLGRFRAISEDAMGSL